MLDRKAAMDARIAAMGDGVTLKNSGGGDGEFCSLKKLLVLAIFACCLVSCIIIIVVVVIVTRPPRPSPYFIPNSVPCKAGYRATLCGSPKASYYAVRSGEKNENLTISLSVPMWSPWVKD